MRWLTAGESHGQALSAIIEGVPAHVSIDSTFLDFHLARRRLGFGRGARQNFEADKISIIGGVRLGQSQGGPISIQVGNSEWPKWEKVMSADPVDASEIEGLARNAPLTRPRPGHADLVGMQKYDFDDARPILERASARETAARVALGAVARAFLEQSVGITILSHVISIGTVRVPDTATLPAYSDMSRIDSDPVRCADPETSAKMIEEIDGAHSDGDTLGGVCEILAYNLPPGLGSHVHWDRRLDARLASAMMGIQAIKGVEIGAGFKSVAQRGSEHGDEMHPDGFASNHSGGTLGGISSGQDLRVSIAIKPTSSIMSPKQSIDLDGKPITVQTKGRHDPCVGIRATPIAEAMLALVLMDHALRHRAQCADVTLAVKPIPASRPGSTLD